MKRSILLSLILLLAAAWLSAQQTYPSGTTSSGQNSSPGSEMDSQTTVEGCLHGSSQGDYTLTDKSGNTYQLTGNTAPLRNHVGHEMRVTGLMASESASSSSGTMGAGKHGIRITSFQHMSPSCSGSR